ncbi:MAG: hypothetical protein PVG39_00280 [Desulfobacteraceae bacterium]|jgi:hypothetical protein
MKKKDKRTIGIFTNFQEFNPGYSLTGIVVDQSLMLLENGHDVHVFVNETFNSKYNQDARISYLMNKFRGKFHLHKATKFMHLIDYETKSTLTEDHKKALIDAAKIFTDSILKFDIDRIYTHDFIFTGWNLPYALAIKEASRLLSIAGKQVYWLHWIHSVPGSHRRDWWDINQYGDNHLIVFPNNIEINRICETFMTNPSRVRMIPHIKDIRTWYDFSDESWEFTKRYPQIMEANVVQVYPISTDRMSAKQLQLVIKIFGYMKQAKVPVFLCAANQWATGRRRKEDVNKYILLAEHCGLEYGKEFVFTSEYSYDPVLNDIIESSENFEELDQRLPKCESSGDEKDDTYGQFLKGIKWDGDFAEEKVRLLQLSQPYATGISRRMLRELQLLSNLFIFPTREESFGLVGPEAAFSGALCIINRSLIMQFEVMGSNAPAFDFGSHYNNTPSINDEKYIRGVSFAILNRIYSNEAITTKIHCRRRYNMNSIYNRYYVPNAI